MPKVLVVDDSKVDRRLVCEFLRKESQWTVEDAANGVEALARMKDSAPDLVLTDLNMPEMDGLELVNALREHHPGVPVILVTGYRDEMAQAIEAALRIGAYACLYKPLQIEKLFQRLIEVRRQELSRALDKCADSSELISANYRTPKR